MNNYHGLNNDEVIISRKKHGSNTFTKKKQDSFLKLILETFSDPIIKILLIALGIKTLFLIKDFDWYETIGIIIAIVHTIQISISRNTIIGRAISRSNNTNGISTKIGNPSILPPLSTFCFLIFHH